MEAKDAIKAISVRQLLLAPIYLLHELYAALIPGVIFLFLFLLKRSHFVASVVSATTMLGYKTRRAVLPDAHRVRNRQGLAFGRFPWVPMAGGHLAMASNANKTMAEVSASHARGEVDGPGSGA